MGRWSRLKRRFRSELQQTYNGTSDETAALTFTSDLVSGEYSNKDLWQHQLKVAWEDPIAHRICVQLPNNVFDDWFTIKKYGEDGELEDHPKNAQIQEELERMNAKYWFTQAAIGESIFGTAALVFNLNEHRADVQGEGYQVATLDVFTPQNSHIPQEAYDRKTGEPDHLVVNPNAYYGDVKREVPWDELQWWCLRPKGRSYEGYHAMYQIWDLMTYLRESVDAMAWVHKKLGIGVWMWYTSGGMSDELKDSLEDTLKNMSSRRAIVCEKDDFEKVEWSGPASSGTTAIVEGADYILGMISSGSAIPKDIFTGVSAGAITGSEVNNKALYATISKKQSEYGPYVLNAIERMGYKTDGMILEWNTRYATDELEQAQIRLLNAQADNMDANTAQTKKMMEQGVNPNDINIRAGQEASSQKDQTKTNNQTGVQG